jgi:hypothetical protein
VERASNRPARKLANSETTDAAATISGSREGPNQVRKYPSRAAFPATRWNIMSAAQI